MASAMAGALSVVFIVVLLSLVLWTKLGFRPFVMGPVLCEYERASSRPSQDETKPDVTKVRNVTKARGGHVIGREGTGILQLTEQLRKQISSLYNSFDEITISANTESGLRWNMPLQDAGSYDNDVHLLMATVFGPTVLNLVACGSHCRTDGGGCTFVYEGLVYSDSETAICETARPDRGAWKNDVWVSYTDACREGWGASSKVVTPITSALEECIQVPARKALCPCPEAQKDRCVPCGDGTQCSAPARDPAYDPSWVASPTGCVCYFDANRHDCACCAPEPPRQSPSPLMKRTLSKLSRSLRSKRVLFIGDSTLEELALMVTYAMGYPTGSFTRMQEGKSQSGDLTDLCQKTTSSQYRQYDAMGRKANLSMVWAGRDECAYNGQGVTVAWSDTWKAILAKKVASVQPEIVFFQVPIAHSCFGQVDGHDTPCYEALRAYIYTIMHTVPAVLGRKPRFVLVLCGIPPIRMLAGAWQYCRRNHRYWARKTRQLLNGQEFSEINLIQHVESYLDLRVAKDPWDPHCQAQVTGHLTCLPKDSNLFQNFEAGLCDDHFISAMARLGMRLIMEMLQ